MHWSNLTEDIYFSLLDSSNIYFNTFSNILDWTDGITTRDLDPVEDFGLSMMDDIDAFALNLLYGDDHIFDKGKDQILFSLTPDNPWGFSGADVFLSFGDGEMTTYLTAAQIGLQFDDNVDALDAVPEPTTMLLLGSGLIGLVALRRKVRKS